MGLSVSKKKDEIVSIVQIRHHISYPTADKKIVGEDIAKHKKKSGGDIYSDKKSGMDKSISYAVSAPIDIPGKPNKEVTKSDVDQYIKKIRESGFIYIDESTIKDILSEKSNMTDKCKLMNIDLSDATLSDYSSS